MRRFLYCTPLIAIMIAAPASAMPHAFWTFGFQLPAAQGHVPRFGAVIPALPDRQAENVVGDPRLLKTSIGKVGDDAFSTAAAATGSDRDYRAAVE
jgi:hypothetical protein